MFDPLTPREQRDESLKALVAAAQEGLTQLQAKGGTIAVHRLGDLYERTATYLATYAEKQEAEAALALAKTSLTAQAGGHVTDIGRVKMLAEQGYVILSPDLFDMMRDPDDLRAGAAAFAKLAETCR